MAPPSPEHQGFQATLAAGSGLSHTHKLRDISDKAAHTNAI